MLILGVLMVAEAAGQVLTAIFQSHERMVVPAVARIVANALMLALVVVALRAGHGARMVAAVLVVSALVRIAIQGWAVPRLAGFRMPVAATPAWRGLLAAGLPFFLANGLGVFFFRINVIMLGAMTSDAAVGWFGVANRLMDALNFVPQFLTMATFPVAARLWLTSPADFRATVRKTLHLLLVVTVPAAVVHPRPRRGDRGAALHPGGLRAGRPDPPHPRRLARAGLRRLLPGRHPHGDRPGAAVDRDLDRRVRWPVPP